MAEAAARILLWGIAGAGKSRTLEMIRDRLQPELRGELEHLPTPLDPMVQYDRLPISLGASGGVENRIELIEVPSGEADAPTRKQLLDRVDGMVLVIDASPERIADNRAILDELRLSLDDYGRALGSLPIVIQYNKRDLADPFAIEALHRDIGLENTAVFETIATTGHGVMATLTTIAKHVVRARRNEISQTGLEAPPQAAAQPTRPDDSISQVLEGAILEEHDDEALLLETESLDFGPSLPDWNAVAGDEAKGDASGLRVVSVGQASLEADASIRLPLVVGDADGTTRSLVLSLRLDPAAPGGDD